MEYKCDTGYEHIGVSICTEKREIVHEQYDLLTNETEHHNDQRKYRRARRNRNTRYRAPRFNNRKGMITKDGFAPSIRNKRDRHVDIYKAYVSVMPITNAVFEMGQFDTQVLKAVEEGRPLPEGTDYQHGERYGTETLREAVFTRDNYKCIICGRGIKEHAILHVHHVGFWKGDRTNRMANLATVCEKCHTGKNHKPGGALYGIEPKMKTLKEATFMTMVRFDMFKRIKEIAPDVECHITYGAKTKLSRKDLGIKKSHANDAYAMGKMHPKWRAELKHYKKRRRNNRILEKFYDAKIIDARTGEKVSGADLGCGRTKRNIPRDNDQNLRVYRGQTVTKGRRTVRRTRYPLQSGSIVKYKGQKYMTGGLSHYGSMVSLHGIKKQVKASMVQVLSLPSGWLRVV